MTADTPMTPAERVRAYYEAVWIGGQIERIAEFCADGVTRHDLKGTVTLSHAQQRERLLSHPGFKHRIIRIFGDHQFATMFFEVRRPDDELLMAGIEVLRFEDGKIVENWTGVRPGLDWSA